MLIKSVQVNQGSDFSVGNIVLYLPLWSGLVPLCAYGRAVVERKRIDPRVAGSYVTTHFSPTSRAPTRKIQGGITSESVELRSQEDTVGEIRKSQVDEQEQGGKKACDRNIIGERDAFT